jgi:hypothetical protein
MMPSTFDEAYRMARAFANSELVPKTFRGKPDDILVALQLAAEVGFPPMQGLQSIAVINGRPTIWGEGLLALVLHSPHYADHDEWFEVDAQRRDGLTAEDLLKPTTCAVCTFVRNGKATPITRRFSVAQARKAGLLGVKDGAGKEGPWQTYPDRMLMMRARMTAARDGFPDVLRGIQATEDVIDLPPEPKAPTPILRRISEGPPQVAPAADGHRSVAEVPTCTVVAGVKRIDQFLGGWTVTLTDGVLVDTATVEDALELEKFVDTPHKLELVYTAAVDGSHELRSFKLAE